MDGGAGEIVAPPEKIDESVSEPDKPLHKPENSEIPKIEPKFPDQIYTSERKGPGRQRKKSGVSLKSGKDGVQEMFFLWFDEGNGQSFGEFYRNDLSDDMSNDTWGYYPKHFIQVKGKFHGEYLQYRREYRQKFGEKFGNSNARTHRSKVIPIRGNRA